MISTLQVYSRAGVALLFGSLATTAATAAAVDATFVLDQQQSNLTFDASTVVFITFRDSDTQALGGAINTTLDFGMSGTLPPSAGIVVTSAAISPLAPFSLTLGLPPLGVNVSVRNAVADITTPNPAATLTRLAVAPVRYEFDAAEFDVTLNQGMVIVSGASNQSIDLATMPVTGSAQSGTRGRLTLTETGVTGFFTQYDALLELPITFSELVDVDGRQVALDVTGDVIANSSFAIALTRIPADFDEDGDVDADDLTWWEADFGGPGADTNGDHDSDGADFIAWQKQFGLGVSPFSASQAVPEPGTSALLSVSLILASWHRLHNQQESDLPRKNGSPE